MEVSIIGQNWLIAQYFNYCRPTAKNLPWLSTRQKFELLQFLMTHFRKQNVY